MFLLHTATDLSMTSSEKQIRSSQLTVAEQVHHSQFPHPLHAKSRNPKIYICVNSLLDK
jgi:hypothetical protein